VLMLGRQSANWVGDTTLNVRFGSEADIAVVVTNAR
jgi:hypothetical protein